MRTDDNSHTAAVMNCFVNLRSDMCVEFLLRAAVHWFRTVCV